MVQIKKIGGLQAASATNTNSRITGSLIDSYTSNSINGVPIASNNQSLLAYNSSLGFNPLSSFQDSISGDRNKYDHPLDVVQLSKTLLFNRAIEKIANGVANLPWTIDSLSKETSEEDELISSKLKKSLKRPNKDEHSSYRKLIQCIVKDLLIFNISSIERQSGDEENPFFLWSVDPRTIHINTNWDTSLGEKEPRYFHRPSLSSTKKQIPLQDSELFLIQLRTSSWEFNPESPVITAYKQINTWLKLSKGQDVIVENPIRNYLVSLEEGSEEQLGAFKQYWNTHVLGRTAPPIIRGKVNIQSISAESDSQLFLQFTEYLISLIALAFNLSKRDYNLTDHDNRATSEVSADSSFQEAILPIAKTVIDYLNMEVIEFYSGGKFQLHLGELEARKQDIEANIVQTLYTSNIATKNEMRKRIGLEAIEGGDVFSFQEQQGQATQGQPERMGEIPPTGSAPPKTITSNNVKQKEKENLNKAQKVKASAQLSLF